MNISKRDRNLLILLGIIAVLAAYYFLLMQPQEAKLNNLHSEVLTQRAAKQEVEMRIASEEGLDKQIENLQEQLNVASEPFFSDLTQEELLMTVNSFASGLPMDISGVTLSDATTNDLSVVHSAQVDYTGDYATLLSYLRNVRNYDKVVVVDQLSVKNDYEGEISGRFELAFNGIPSIEAFSTQPQPFVTEAFDAHDLILGPFSPYSGFIVSDSTSENLVEYPQDTEIIDYETYRPKVQIYGFEDGDSFFVGSTEDMTGSVSRSRTAVAGGYSSDLTFDFMASRAYSEANVVFDTNPVVLTRQAEYLGIWAYAYEASTHAIGVVLIDSSGKEFRIELADQVDWTGWKEIEALLPVEITYPCMVQRIYVEGAGFDQKLTGRYLFDQLEVSYPIN